MRKIKDPNETLDYQIDWSKRLEDGESITQSEFLDPVPSTVPALVIQNENRSGTATQFWTTGGKDGEVYSITNRVTTDNTPPRVMDWTVKIACLEK